MKLLLMIILLISPVYAQDPCPNGFEIWQEGSGICNTHPTHKQAEEHWNACGHTVEQLMQVIADLQGVPSQPLPPHNLCTGKWGGGNLYRPKSNRNAPVVVLKQSYCFEDRSITTDMRPLNISLTDTAGNIIDRGTFRYCNLINEGRLHHDFPRSAGITGPIQVLVEYEDGRSECFDVPDATKEYR